METETPYGPVIEEPVAFTALDGYPLSGLFVAAERPRASVLIQAGTGFPKEFYRRFARFGAERGAACFLYDYRGIAGSAPDRMRGFPADYPDWGRLDAPAAIDALSSRWPDLPMAHIAHSVGGHFLGFTPNQDRLERHAFVNVGTGYWGRHFLWYRPIGLLFWWIYGPAVMAFAGHVPSGGLWGGTALPKSVFTTWRRWSNKPGYFSDELADRLQPHHFEAVAAPIRSFIYTDDPIANVRTAADILSLYPNAPTAIVERKPSHYGLKSLGHAGVFRKAAASAWPEIWDWALDARTA